VPNPLSPVAVAERAAIKENAEVIMAKKVVATIAVFFSRWH
jgi:hypothetical protein